MLNFSGTFSARTLSLQQILSDKWENMMPISPCLGYYEQTQRYQEKERYTRLRYKQNKWKKAEYKQNINYTWGLWTEQVRTRGLPAPRRPGHCLSPPFLFINYPPWASALFSNSPVMCLLMVKEMMGQSGCGIHSKETGARAEQNAEMTWKPKGREAGDRNSCLLNTIDACWYQSLLSWAHWLMILPCLQQR